MEGRSIAERGEIGEPEGVREPAEIARDDRVPGPAGPVPELAEEVFAPGLDPLERMRAAEKHTKAIYVHAHMDEGSFDTDRIRQCPVAIREPDGQNVPSCAYNVLYRERDARFMEQPKQELVTLGKGRLRA